MKLGELKKSLAKLPPDMDDMQVLLIYAQGGKRQYECVCFTGYIPHPGAECVAIGGMSEIQRQVEAGEIAPPEGYNESFGKADDES